MTEQQIYNLKWKLPKMLFGFLINERKLEILSSMSVDEARLLSFLAAEEFPTDDELKGFCNHFKMSYSTFKTWNVMHLL